jgi:hypothetical protein
MRFRIALKKGPVPLSLSFLRYTRLATKPLRKKNHAAASEKPCGRVVKFWSALVGR